MEKTRLIKLNSKKIAELFQDFVADNAKKLCFAKKVTSSGTFCSFTRNNSSMICDFSQSNKTLMLRQNELEILLNRLPHTGFKCFEMSNKQIQDVIKREHSLSIEELNFPATNSNKNNFLMLTLNEIEMREILYKQVLVLASSICSFDANNISLSMKLDFDGEESTLIVLYSNTPINIDLSKLNANILFSTFSSAGFDYDYIDLSDSELKDLMK